MLAVPPTKTLYNDGSVIATDPQVALENQIRIPLLFTNAFPNYMTTIEMRSKDYTDIRTFVLSMQINPKPI